MIQPADFRSNATKKKRNDVNPELVISEWDILRFADYSIICIFSLSRSQNINKKITSEFKCVSYLLAFEKLSERVIKNIDSEPVWW